MKKVLIVLIIGMVVGAVGYLFVGNMSIAGQALVDRKDLTNETPISPTLTPTPIVLEKPADPKEVNIPTLGVTAAIENVGLDSELRMDVPKDDYNIAWYRLGPKPGEDGSAVFAGHYDTRAGTPAVFYELSNIEIGDTIIVTDEKDNEITFVVRDVQIYSDADFPIASVFGNQGKKMLNLITCNGTYDRAAQNYSDRVVVFSELN
jgi:LPXTG-site transpeptidase (sortase) family protein